MSTSVAKLSKLHSPSEVLIPVCVRERVCVCVCVCVCVNVCEYVCVCVCV